jgi:hypothetical protein
MTELTRHASFDPRPESYAGFLDPEWAKSFLDASKDTKLEQPAFDLVRNWHAASNARSLPLVMTECVKEAERKMLDEHEPMERQKIRLFTQKVVGKLEQGGEKVRPMLKRRIQEAIEAIDLESDVALRNAKATVSEARADLWEALLGQNDFVTSIWALERLCYSSLYYNYEWFLTECVRIKRSDPEYRFRRHDDFKKDFREAFGPELQQECWSHHGVVIARFARHALLHNGGRMTQDLQRQPHNLLVNGDEIQIGAPHTNDLFALLSKKVLKVADRSRSLTEFQK